MRQEPREIYNTTPTPQNKMKKIETIEEAATQANATLQRLAYAARRLQCENPALFRQYFADLDLEFADKIGSVMDELEEVQA